MRMNPEHRPAAAPATLLLCLATAAWVALALTARPVPARAEASAGPAGLWETEGGKSHVKIEACGANLCGTIVWLKEPLDAKGQEKTDSENPDAALKSRKLVGLTLLSGFIQDKDDAALWTDGKIYNPDDGKIYTCKLTVVDAKTLKVRGYVGIPLLGKTQIWTRVE